MRLFFPLEKNKNLFYFIKKSEIMACGCGLKRQSGGKTYANAVRGNKKNVPKLKSYANAVKGNSNNAASAAPTPEMRRNTKKTKSTKTNKRSYASVVNTLRKEDKQLVKDFFNKVKEAKKLFVEYQRKASIFRNGNRNNKSNVGVKELEDEYNEYERKIQALLKETEKYRGLSLEDRLEENTYKKHKQVQAEMQKLTKEQDLVGKQIAKRETAFLKYKDSLEEKKIELAKEIGSLNKKIFKNEELIKYYNSYRNAPSEELTIKIVSFLKAGKKRQAARKAIGNKNTNRNRVTGLRLRKKEIEKALE